MDGFTTSDAGSRHEDTTMARKTAAKKTAAKSRGRVARNLPVSEAKASKKVKGGVTGPHVGGIQVALGDGSVRLADGSVRVVKSSITN
jgi:hypothetical protein